MEFKDKMHAVKVYEDERKLIYKYGHLVYGNKMTGELSITKTDYPSVSTISLEEGRTTRVDEMRIGGQIIMEYQESGVWRDEVRLD